MKASYGVYVGALIVVNSLGLAFAAMGPCEETAPGATKDTIACGSPCVGVFIVYPQQKECKNTNYSSCTDKPNWTAIVYSPKVESTLFGPCYGTSSPYSWKCVQDITSFTNVSGGNTCT